MQIDDFRSYTLDAFTWPEILDLYEWAMPKQAGDNNVQPQARYVFARLTENSGDPVAALVLYRALLEDASQGFTFSQDLVEAVNRLGGENNGE